jgi:hypothetical protein
MTSTPAVAATKRKSGSPGGVKNAPKAMTVPKSVTKHAARIKQHFFIARLAGFEPATRGLEVPRATFCPVLLYPRISLIYTVFDVFRALVFLFRSALF